MIEYKFSNNNNKSKNTDTPKNSEINHIRSSFTENHSKKSKINDKSTLQADSIKDIKYKMKSLPDNDSSTHVENRIKFFKYQQPLKPVFNPRN